MTYVDWEYYSSLFTKVSDEDEFYRIGQRAEIKLNMVTHMRAKRFMEAFDEDSATDYQKQVSGQIKTTMCELINTMYIQDASEMGMGIASVSNDGYSETYKITTAAEKDAQLLAIIRSGLSGTGLAGAI